jgi:hypothetical protein
LIAYELLSREPFKVNECNIGSGGTCGAVFLHRGFEKLLRDKLGSHADSILTKERLSDTLDWFEKYVKRVFNPYDPSDDVTEYGVPMNYATTIREIELVGGYLMLSRYLHFKTLTLIEIRDDIDGIFKKVFRQIESLVRSQIEAVEKQTGSVKVTLAVKFD